jgi:hypothetical protein
LAKNDAAWINAEVVLGNEAPRRAYELNPNSMVALLALAAAEVAAGMPQLHVHLALNLVGMGDIARAKEAFATALQLSPASVERALTGPVYRKPEHVRRTITFMRIAAGLEDPSAADALR